MNILIIEDEYIAAERLKILIEKYDSNIHVIDSIDSIEESILWLKTNKPPDLLMLDIQLADGFSFEIFKSVKYTGPIIFTTAFNEYALDAFKYFSIDYLLKPITYQALHAALNKYRSITAASQVDYQHLFSMMTTQPGASYKERFLARIGQKLVFIKTSDIAYFMADDKIVYLCDNTGAKMHVDYTLDKLETLLNPAIFFRANRKFIISIESIAMAKPYINNRLQIFLKGAQKTDDLIISRERVQEFKTWAEN